MRDQRGRFVPGVSGNVRGRPRGFAGVAEKILSETDDGAELVRYALEIWRDPSRPFAERNAMHAWLSDRGLGKAVAQHELHVTAHQDDETPALAHVSDERFEQLWAEMEGRAEITNGPGNRALPTTTDAETQAVGHDDV